MSELRILRRGEWAATGPLGPAMTIPSRGIIIHHSVTNPTDDPRADMRTLERIGLTRFGRLSYSYAIHPSGVILEGQANRIGAHTRGNNSNAHGICAIGNYEANEPPPVMVEAFRNLYRHGAEQGWWAKNVLGGHRDFTATTCPGRHLYARLDDITATQPQPPPQPEPQPTSWTETLVNNLPLVSQRHNRRGEWARRVQALLGANGVRVANTFNAQGQPDGIFGPGTDAAVKSFQRARRIAVDGIVGRQTWTKLLGR